MSTHQSEDSDPFGKKFHCDRESCFMPIIIPNGVHVHTHWDPVFLVRVQLSPLRMCATSARPTPLQVQVTEKCNIYFRHFVSWNGNEVKCTQRKQKCTDIDGLRPQPTAKHEQHLHPHKPPGLLFLHVWQNPALSSFHYRRKN